MIIYLIGSPGIGKTTLKRFLIEKKHCGRSYVFADAYSVFCTPRKYSFLKFLHLPNRYYSGLLYKLMHFISYRMPTKEERMAAFAKVEQAWRPFLNRWVQCMTDEHIDYIVKMRSMLDLVELLEVRAWMSLYCPANACIIMDESLGNRLDIFSNSSVGRNNAVAYFRIMPPPDVLILLEGNLDEILRRLDERRARQKWTNYRHRGMNADELARDTQWAIELAEMCYSELHKRNVQVLRVNAFASPENITKHVLAHLNETL